MAKLQKTTQTSEQYTFFNSSFFNSCPLLCNITNLYYPFLPWILRLRGIGRMAGIDDFHCRKYATLTLYHHIVLLERNIEESQ